MSAIFRKILLTGGTGLVGNTLLPLLTRENEVWVISRGNHGVGGVHWIDHDLADQGPPAELPESIDTVIHLAQSVHFRDFPERAEDIFAVNVNSTRLLLDWARKTGVRQFIYASSGGIYGHGEQEFREDHKIVPGRPLGFYLASKQCGELLAENYSSIFSVAILRFFFVYGPAQKPTMLIPRLVRSVWEDQPIFLHGNDGIRINPIHVSDAAQAVYNALQLSGSEKINVAGPEVMTFRAIGEIIGAHLGRKPKFNKVEDSAPMHLVGDISKMCRLLHPPQIGFEDGIAEMCARIKTEVAGKSGS